MELTQKDKMTEAKFFQRNTWIKRNMKMVEGKINMRHYAEWHNREEIHLCHCAGPGTPSTMCCENYYAEDFKYNDWVEISPLFSRRLRWLGINPKTYWKLRKENTLYLYFLLLIAGHCYPTTKILRMLDVVLDTEIEVPRWEAQMANKS